MPTPLRRTLTSSGCENGTAWRRALRPRSISRSTRTTSVDISNPGGECLKSALERAGSLWSLLDWVRVSLSLTFQNAQLDLNRSKVTESGLEAVVEDRLLLDVVDMSEPMTSGGPSSSIWRSRRARKPDAWKPALI
jgi:hypothetical protein